MRAPRPLAAPKRSPLTPAAARAEAELQRATQRSDFAFLALGRDCINGGVSPPGVNAQLREIGQLRGELDNAR